MHIHIYVYIYMYIHICIYAYIHTATHRNTLQLNLRNKTDNEGTRTPWSGLYTLNIRDVTHCNTLQHTATHYNTLQHIATHCNTLQHTATPCNTLQHTARHLRNNANSEGTRSLMVRVVNSHIGVVDKVCLGWHREFFDKFPDAVCCSVL